ncbi:hypothetical protein JCM8115_005307 [Rhodotorula mucilaginosa]
MVPTSMDELRKLKRAELQALAKENNIKANLKTDALVEALAGVFQVTSQPNSAAGDQSRPLTARAVSRTRARPAPTDISSAEPGPQSQGDEEKENGIAAQVDSLVALVATLQSELREARQTITNTRELLEAQRSGSEDLVSAAEVKALIETALDGRRRTQEKEAQIQKHDLAEQICALQEAGAQRHARAAEESARLLERLSRLEDAHATQESQATALADLSAQVDAIESRLGTLERSGNGVEARKDDLMASPTGSDAPPTQTLISFSSPAVTPLSANIAAESRPSTFKPAVQSGTPGPRALPSHMLAAATSATRRTPRAAFSASQPESPVPLPSNASLGKHGRSSDASDLSVVVDDIASLDGTPDRSGGGFHTAPSSVARIDPTSHAHKRLRMSASRATAADEVEPTRGAASSDENEDDDEDESEAREYTVRTKTGSSPIVTTGGLRSASITRDPSFFASRPVSPSARPARSRASSVASNTDQNVAPSQAGGNRKSLPLSALPFPIVSPYRRAVSKSSAPTPSVASKSQLPGSLFGGPTNAATPNTRGKSGFGDFFSGLDSVNRAEASRQTSLFTTSNSSTRKANLPPPTPPASRTLFGTEVADNGRFGDAGAEADEEEEDDSPRLRWGAFAA